MKRTLFIRRIQFQNYLETFLVTSVSTIILVRFFLSISGYPQLGGGGIHVAHVLWGGLLLMIANVLLFTYIGNSVRIVSVVLGGIGFGLFIDELGKFITSDTNYFFAPTFSLIYIIFVLLFVFFHRMGKRAFSKEEYLVNSVSLMQEALMHDMTKEEKERAYLYLERSGETGEIVNGFTRILHGLSTSLPSRFDTLILITHSVQSKLRGVSQHTWFTRFITVFFLGVSVYTFLFTLFLVFVFSAANKGNIFVDLQPFEVIELIVTFLSGFLVLYGVYVMRRSRLRAYIYFKRYVLISIFVTQVFSFYFNQLSAVTGLLFNLALLAGLNFLIERESLDLAAQRNTIN